MATSSNRSRPAVARRQAMLAAVWGLAHGLADLVAAGRMKPLQSLPSDARMRLLRPCCAGSFRRGTTAELPLLGEISACAPGQT